MQRLLDILFSGMALIVLSPLLVPVVVILRLTGEGEVFFLQERVGKDGKLFKLYKFATMLKDSPNIGTGTVTMKDDPRILPAGKFLRKTKVNELPQLINILFGDMSVVGPRPQARRCFDAFPESTQKAIVRVRPGLSGVGSIIFRAEEDILADASDTIHFYDGVIAPYKGQVEEWYVNHRGLYTYFAVILVTAWAIPFQKSDLVWQTFPELPMPPDELKQALNYLEQKSAVQARVLFWLGSMMVITLALLPPDYLPAHEPPFSLWDKALHAAAFAGLCLLGLWAYLNRPYSIMLGLLVLGGVIELAQFATGWRHMEFGDFVANAVGIMIGRTVFLLLQKRRAILN